MVREQWRLQIPLARLVSIIKTKIKKIVRKGIATISIYIPENDTEYVMQLPADQAEQGNYKFNPGMDPATGLPKKGAADPAKRNLVLELLKGGRRLSTGEIEKALGGGKYTNNAYRVLTELAKEGLVAHKQMRWSLKTSKTADVRSCHRKPRSRLRALTVTTRDEDATNRRRPAREGRTFMGDEQQEVLSRKERRNVRHPDSRERRTSARW